MNRKMLHVALGLILVGCLLCPFVELALGWQDGIFSNGYDTASTLAIVMLLFELALGLAGAIALLLPSAEFAGDWARCENAPSPVIRVQFRNSSARLPSRTSPAYLASRPETTSTIAPDP